MGSSLSLLTTWLTPTYSYTPTASHRPLDKPFVIIFGSVPRPWTIDDWKEVSDKIRGGKSASTLRYITPYHSSEGVSFEGTLDAATLGGAGFVSQVYHTPFSLPRADSYSAFFIDVDPLPSTHPLLNKFTFGVKNHNHQGDQSSLIYQCDFTVPLATPQADHNKLQRLVKVRIPFKELVPTFRGRPSPDHAPFDPALTISQISFMVRSFFNVQSGNFFLNVHRLGVE
ncbi:hypothetical protein Pst134EA_021446 [Puccinia striiformis f. sp. tritici]|uniref:hypothetical protein n=1 Tax=Puccinia striiformis f. sp. tritici TaxID=168172 RepID=UPI002007D250|nr:hypothetical protein Pst134EA_021446 [Puccinia striiformis f. sp. tritici]KAH9457573.1 hypothetical protein Pst134EA_021446 [Puccinia striiformis f. sp. tritici]KAI9617549.1 hypothetical protein H4Q26_012847 [Puccinia striiformis f. sp. tritici PST-130]